MTILIYYNVIHRDGIRNDISTPTHMDPYNLDMGLRLTEKRRLYR